MPRRVAAESARETLVTKLANGETNASSGDSTSEPSARQRHIELVRAAGRAALEESLQSGPSGMKRKASEMTAAGIAAQWQAYAEVYGTNGMAAGGGRSSLVEPPGPSPNVPRVQSTEAVGEDEGEVKAEAEAEADAVESAVTATEAEAEAGCERVGLSGASSDVDANGAISTASEARAAPTTSYAAAPEHESSAVPGGGAVLDEPPRRLALWDF